jgi:hypothetical protein
VHVLGILVQLFEQVRMSRLGPGVEKDQPEANVNATTEDVAQQHQRPIGHQSQGAGKGEILAPNLEDDAPSGKGHDFQKKSTGASEKKCLAKQTLFGLF